MKYNIWNKWDPLKVCMLGNNYAPEFFNGIPDKAGDPLKRICEETLEDLAGFKQILQDFGVKVIQPDMDRSERFIDNPSRYPRGPLQPRDFQLVLANTCFVNEGDHPAIVDKLKEYGPVSYSSDIKRNIPFYASKDSYNFIKGADFPTYEQFIENINNKDYFLDFVWEELLHYSDGLHGFSSATTFMIGKRLYIGLEKDIYRYGKKDQVETPQHYAGLPGFDKFNIDFSPMDGHTDGNFHPIKPGAILSLLDVQKYSRTFPGWDVCYLPDQSWSKVKPFLEIKNKNQGKWWLAGEEDNDEFTNFVETWLQDWVGYVEETVFDVNVLMLDEHHCCVSNPNNEQVNSFLKKHNVEPVYVPWRHRYFWDGGLHCITLDLYREGVQQDYFGD
jgi:hypothetical protein